LDLNLSKMARSWHSSEMTAAKMLCFRFASLRILPLFFSVLLFSSGNQAAESKTPADPSKWVTLAGCRLLPKRANDGDSFHVRSGQREFIFRLYFVDCPEVDDSFPDRNREQCEYFGVSAEENRKAGLAAKALTAELLKTPFVVRTRWQNANGRSNLPRHYATVEVGGQDLAEILVRRGLARAKGALANLPNGEHAKERMEKLKIVESEAKANRRGIWAHSRFTNQGNN
jgi:endonuclease YncB( thermonuclease family)